MPVYLDFTHGEIQRWLPTLPYIHQNTSFSREALTDLCNCQVNAEAAEAAEAQSF